MGSVMNMKYSAGALLVSALAGSNPVQAEDALVAYKSLSPGIALDLAQAALADCQRRGHQVAVAVVDRSGVIQVVLRDGTRAFGIELAEEGIEACLLLQAIAACRAGRLLFEGEVHALMPAVLLRRSCYTRGTGRYTCLEGNRSEGLMPTRPFPSCYRDGMR